MRGGVENGVGLTGSFGSVAKRQTDWLWATALITPYSGNTFSTKAEDVTHEHRAKHQHPFAGKAFYVEKIGMR